MVSEIYQASVRTVETKHIRRIMKQPCYIVGLTSQIQFLLDDNLSQIDGHHRNPSSGRDIGYRPENLKKVNKTLI